MEDFTDANHLLAGWERTKRASGWKARTQKYGLNLLPNLRKLQQELRGGTYTPEPENEFVTYEMGKKRSIRAPTVRDVVMQQALVNAVLVPALTPYLIHDNGASLKGKGISFTRRRFEQHLSWYYRRYGREGYVLKMDFRHYFDSIDHEKLFWSLAKHLPDETVLRVLREFLHAGEKGIGIGSVISQIVGIYFPTRIDTYCKTVKRLHCYDAYMDDRIILHSDKGYLWRLLEGIAGIADEMGLFLHPHKTQIIKLSRGFTFLKTRYQLTETGRIVRGIPKDTITRQRRKMKQLAKFVAAGEMELAAFKQQYASWRGNRKHYNAFHTLTSMDRLYKELIIWLQTQKTSRRKPRSYGRNNRELSTFAAISQVPSQTLATTRL